MAWSGQQEGALKDVSAWLKDPYGAQVFRLFGYAGTGKSTLARTIAEGVSGMVNFGAYTGKAADVMRKKGCVGAATLHSLIYKPVKTEWGGVRFELNEDSPVADAALNIIDEVSMVPEKLGKDLESFKTKILVLGDPAQLPPVQGQGYFTHGPRNKPDVMLTEIHRQAADNPIIHMATKVRKGESLELGRYGDNQVISRKDLTPKLVMEADQLIVGLNRTRHTWNARYRQLKDLNPDRPQKGEKLVCLKNASYGGIYNGTTWITEKVLSVKDSWNIWCRPSETEEGNRVVNVKVRKEFFVGREEEIDDEDRRKSHEFDYGYAITAHKAQGSQWDKIVVNDESGAFRDDAKRWLYTAITRAAEQLTLIAA